jgi:non-canonical purine NTP pyrophosphatase (RdgB/HAM1 family)
MLPTFITGNQDKVTYLSRLLGYELEHIKIDLEEIQSKDPVEVIEHKVRQAYDIIKKPVLVEDTSLCINALDGLPGTFIKFFTEASDGLNMICHMVDGFEDRSAYASAIYGYYDGVKVQFFSGRLDGQIAKKPSGVGGYGWDQIFIPDGYSGLTRAELSTENDIKTYAKTRGDIKTFLSGLSNEVVEKVTSDVNAEISILQVPTGMKVPDAMRQALNRLFSRFSDLPKATNIQEVVDNPYSALIFAIKGDIPSDDWDLLPTELYCGTTTLLMLTSTTHKIASFYEVVVEAGNEGKGIGKRLMNKAIEIGKQNGVTRFDLTSSPNKVAAQALYEKVGFKKRETNNWRLEV